MEFKLVHLKTLEKMSPVDFKSPTKLAGEVFPEKGYEWAQQHGSAKMSPICKFLVELGYAERSNRGWYRLTELGQKRLLEAANDPKDLE